MKRVFWTLMLTLSFTVAAYAVRTVTVNAAGMGIDADQSTADSAADAGAK